jgi:F-type H+-transporting ATPase subunit b
MKELIEPSLGLIFWTGISFLILLVLLRKFAWKPILDAVNAREENITAAMATAEKARAEIADLSKENEKLLAETRLEKDRILADAKKTKESILTEAKATAEAEGKRIIETARLAIETEKQAALTEVKNMVATLSIDVAEKILRRQMENKGEHEAFVKKHLEDIKLN